MYPDTERERHRPPHTGRYLLEDWCLTVPFVSWLNSVHRKWNPHTEEEIIRPPHISRYCLKDQMLNSSNCFLIYIQCPLVPIVSWLNCVHRQMHPHTGTQKFIPPHIDNNRLMNQMHNRFNCFLIEICSQADGSTHWYREIQTTTYWQQSLDESNAQQV